MCVCESSTCQPNFGIFRVFQIFKFQGARVGVPGGGSALEGAQGGVRKMGASVRFGGVLCGNGPNTALDACSELRVAIRPRIVFDLRQRAFSEILDELCSDGLP